MRQETSRAGLMRVGRGCFEGFALRQVARTTSTQDVVRSLAQGGAAEGACCLAAEQTRGRGRQGRAWTAAPGSAMLVSILLRRPAASLAGIPIAAGLAVADAVEQLAAVEPRLRWPNDVLVGGRKLAGILVEAGAAGPGTQRAVVLGVGLNLGRAAAPPGLAATSLEEEAATAPPGPAAALAALLPRLRERLDRLGEAGVAGLLADWRARWAGRGEPVVAETPAGRLHGVALDVDGDGALVVETAAGRRRIVAGDVHLVAAPPPARRGSR